MSRNAFTPRARRELIRAAAKIAEDNPDVADELISEAIAAAERICAAPMQARTELRLAPARYRFWSLQRFHFLLVIDSEATPPVVARFVHQSRDLVALLGHL